MFAAMSRKSLQRVLDLVAFAESAEATPGSIWENPEFRRRFADTTDTEWRVAASMLRDRLAKREHIADLKVKMAECAGNVVDLQSRLLETTRSVIEATAQWLASDPPALRGKKQGKKS